MSTTNNYSDYFRFQLELSIWKNCEWKESKIEHAHVARKVVQYWGAVNWGTVAGLTLRATDITVKWNMSGAAAEEGNFMRSQAYRSLRNFTRFYMGKEKNKVRNENLVIFDDCCSLI